MLLCPTFLAAFRASLGILLSSEPLYTKQESISTALRFWMEKGGLYPRVLVAGARFEFSHNKDVLIMNNNFG